nr:ParB N-terminal domain-containing protein [Bacillus alveayuensis]
MLDVIEYYKLYGKIKKPIVVRKHPHANMMYILKDGYARYLAAQDLGLENVEVLVEK